MFKSFDLVFRVGLLIQEHFFVRSFELFGIFEMESLSLVMVF